MMQPIQCAPVRREAIQGPDHAERGGVEPSQCTCGQSQKPGVEPSQSICDGLTGMGQQLCYALLYGISED
jgi:hypothetical protein